MVHNCRLFARKRADDFIAKPIDVDQMFATIARHLPVRQGKAPPLAGRAENGVFDPCQLMAVAQGNPAYLRKTLDLIGKLVEGAPELARQASEAWRQGRSEEATRLLHTMRGSIGTLGAQRYAVAARALEAAMRQGDAARVDALLGATERELEATLGAARQWLAEQAEQVEQEQPQMELDAARLMRLKMLLGERDLQACDEYGELRAALAGRMSGEDFAGLECAMAQLDFETAQQCLAVLP